MQGRLIALVVVLTTALATIEADVPPNPIGFLESGQPRRWDKNSLIYAWVGTLPASFPEPFRSDRPRIDALIRDAFNAWSAASIPQVGLRFNAQPIATNGEQSIQTADDVKNIEDRDIVVVFMDGYDQIVNEPYDSSGAAYERGELRNPRQGLTSTIIAINNGAIESVSNFQAVLLHEIGHALGLDHSSAHWEGASAPYDRPRFVLLPVMNPAPRDRRTLHPDDRAALAELYQPTPPMRQDAPTRRTTQQRTLGESPIENPRFGWIRGRVVNGVDGIVPVNGVQVIAVRLVEGKAPINDIEHQETFTSITPHGENLDGTFWIMAPPGEYRLYVRQVPIPFQFRVTVYQGAVRELSTVDVFVSPGGGTSVPSFPVTLQ